MQYSAPLCANPSADDPDAFADGISNMASDFVATFQKGNANALINRGTTDWGDARSVELQLGKALLDWLSATEVGRTLGFKDSSDTRSLGYYLGTLGLGLNGLNTIAQYISNPCSTESLLGDDEFRTMTNAHQLLLLDPGNETGQRAYSAEEACCKCGGGTTRFQQDPVIRSALMDFYKSTKGWNWITVNKYGSYTWNTSSLAAFTSGEMRAGLYWNTSLHYCLWYGTRCDDKGRLISMGMLGNNLDGSIPDSFGNLTDLRAFTTVVNPLTGTLPSTLSKLTKLKVFGLLDVSDFFGFRSISGTLPQGLPALESLLVLGDAISGTLTWYAVTDLVSGF